MIISYRIEKSKSFVYIIQVTRFLEYNFGMNKLLVTIFTFFIVCNVSFSAEKFSFFNSDFLNSDIRNIKSVLNAQVRYANKTNMPKFIGTYDKTYKNADGYDLDTYASLVKDLWQNYDNIKYGVKIKNIHIDGDIAEVELTESSYANIPVSKKMSGMLKSEANSIYYLKKNNGKWKVISDKVIDEETSMLYGSAINTDIKLTAPEVVEPNYEYTASLEFEVPKDIFAIASIAKDKVEYPQKQAKEVFRKMPEDNILERLFISNTDKCNEYIIASIGLTKANVEDLSIKLSLVGFGYKIIRVNVKGAGVDVEKWLNIKSAGESNVKEQ